MKASTLNMCIKSKGVFSQVPNYLKEGKNFRMTVDFWKGGHVKLKLEATTNKQTNSLKSVPVNGRFRFQ